MGNIVCSNTTRQWLIQQDGFKMRKDISSKERNWGKRRLCWLCSLECKLVNNVFKWIYNKQTFSVHYYLLHCFVYRTAPELQMDARGVRLHWATKEYLSCHSKF